MSELQNFPGAVKEPEGRTTTALLAQVKARLAAATPEHAKTAAEHYAEIWLVAAADRVVASLKEPDDVPTVLEVAFTDGYRTGFSHAHAHDDLAKLLAIVEVMQAALEKFQTIPAAPDAFIELAMCEMRSFASEALLAADKLAGE